MQRLLGSFALLTLLLLLPAGAFAQAAASTPAFPLSINTNSGGVPILVDANNTPFLIIGDSPQDMAQKLPIGGSLSMSSYFTARQGQGFWNTVNLWITCSANDNVCDPSGATFDGIAPFTGTISGCGGSLPDCYDLSTPNPDFFARIDAEINMAGTAHMAAIVNVLSGDFCGGYVQALVNSGAAKATAYGQYLGNRYNNYDNIIWLIGGDYNCDGNTQIDDLMLDVINGILSTSPRSNLVTLQLDDFRYSTQDVGNNWAAVPGMLNAAYDYYPIYGEIISALSTAPALPAFLLESDYEGENNLGYQATADSPLRGRHEVWWTLTSGSSGFVYGNHYVWQFAAGWQDNLATTEVAQFSYAANFFNMLSWWKLAPDVSSALVTAGRRDYATTGACSPRHKKQCMSVNTYVTAALANDKSFAVVYTPAAARAITVSMSALNPKVTAQWYDPTADPTLANSYSTICSPGGTPCGSGSQRFSNPSHHADGTDDWVLLLTAAGS